jgi:hypothetical protein
MSNGLIFPVASLHQDVASRPEGLGVNAPLTGSSHLLLRRFHSLVLCHHEALDVPQRGLTSRQSSMEELTHDHARGDASQQSLRERWHQADERRTIPAANSIIIVIFRHLSTTRAAQVLSSRRSTWSTSVAAHQRVHYRPVSHDGGLPTVSHRLRAVGCD